MDETMTSANGSTVADFDHEVDDDARGDTPDNFDHEADDDARDDTDGHDDAEVRPVRKPRPPQVSAVDRLASVRLTTTNAVTAAKAEYDQELAALNSITRQIRTKEKAIAELRAEIEALEKEHAAQNTLTVLAYKKLGAAEQDAGIAEKDRTRAHVTKRRPAKAKRS